MKFALVQMNPTVGAVAENAGKIVQAAQEASSGAEVAVFPEQAVGIRHDPCRLDSWMRWRRKKKLVGRCQAAAGDCGRAVARRRNSTTRRCSSTAASAWPWPENAAAELGLTSGGLRRRRWCSAPGCDGRNICEDSWWRTANRFTGCGRLRSAGDLSASPYCRGRQRPRRNGRKTTVALGVPLLYEPGGRAGRTGV